MSGVGGAADKAARAGEQVNNSSWFDRLIQVGLVAYGVVYVLVGWLAIQVALGDGEGKMSSTGALQQLREQPMGLFLLWAVGLGLLALVLWRVLEAAIGHQDEDGKDRVRKRVGSAAKAVMYAALAISAIRMAMGQGSSGGSSEQTLSAKLLQMPFGPFLVGLVGLGVLGYGCYQIYKGFNDKHAKELASEGKSGKAGDAYLLFGKIGFIAKGIAVGMIGMLFIWTAFTHDADKSGGLDQALSTLAQQPFGKVLLFAVAVGLVAYGLFSFARARHLSR